MIYIAKVVGTHTNLCLAHVRLSCGVRMLYHQNRFLMGMKMSDEIDTDMIEESLIVIDQACAEFKKSVFLRATREMDWQARHKADDVIVCFDAVKYSGHRRTKDLMLVELDQLCQELDQVIRWSYVNRPFDVATYEHILSIAQLVKGAVYSALGIYRPALQLLPLMGLKA
ncbi:hypothetical protein [Comamonas avium]|jgi:hypothetical protein|uniref:Uncharacterized protein n=1 Tax=Comamonas avium TaxID=2762231 RepID=A0ABR8SEX1_9BURK|nr:hypothetical protein [Comamonas avium]MBD7962012.1 hypothetical protein [Comamonas avium]